MEYKPLAESGFWLPIPDTAAGAYSKEQLETIKREYFGCLDFMSGKDKLVQRRERLFAQTFGPGVDRQSAGSQGAEEPGWFGLYGDGIVVLEKIHMVCTVVCVCLINRTP